MLAIPWLIKVSLSFAYTMEESLFTTAPGEKVNAKITMC